MKPRWLLLGAMVVAALVIAGVLLSWRAAIPDSPPSHRMAFSRQQIDRGRALALLGDCVACHTADEGKPFAGGRALETPFGTVYSTNITPDRNTGIGRWPLAAFARALRQGIARDGTHLYPAFPYDYFAEASGADIAALYAYLMTREPLAAPARHNRLLPPFEIRTLLAGWNFLFFHRDPFRPDATKSAAWNRGAYLVESLGHCGACHTPHNAFGAEETDRALDGGVVEHWEAPPLNALSPAPVAWTAGELASYLSTGVETHHGAALGPMRRVTLSLAAAPPSDVRAIATYVASLMPRKMPARVPQGPPDSHAAAVFAGACASCHDKSRWPLEGSTTLAEASARDALEVVLHGIPWRSDRLYMPPFAASLDDTEAAELANYLRTQFASRAAWDDAQSAARQVRSETEER